MKNPATPPVKISARTSAPFFAGCSSSIGRQMNGSETRGQSGCFAEESIPTPVTRQKLDVRPVRARGAPARLRRPDSRPPPSAVEFEQHRVDRSRHTISGSAKGPGRSPEVPPRTNIVRRNSSSPVGIGEKELVSVPRQAVKIVFDITELSPNWVVWRSIRIRSNWKECQALKRRRATIAAGLE